MDDLEFVQVTISHDYDVVVRFWVVLLCCVYIFHRNASSVEEVLVCGHVERCCLDHFGFYYFTVSEEINV